MGDTVKNVGDAGKKTQVVVIWKKGWSWWCGSHGEGGAM